MAEAKGCMWRCFTVVVLITVLGAAVALLILNKITGAR